MGVPEVQQLRLCGADNGPPPVGQSFYSLAEDVRRTLSEGCYYKAEWYLDVVFIFPGLSD